MATTKVWLNSAGRASFFPPHSRRKKETLLAGWHRVAMSIVVIQAKRIKRSNHYTGQPQYRLYRSSIPRPNISLINLLFENWMHSGSCRFQIHLCILACIMSCEFTRKAVMKFLSAQFSWIWSKCNYVF